MLIVGVTQVYNNRGIYLCNTILVTKIFVIDIQQLITPLRNNIFNEI